MLISQSTSYSRFGFGGLEAERVDNHHEAFQAKESSGQPARENFHHLVIAGIGSERVANAMTDSPHSQPSAVNISTSQLLGGDAPLAKEIDCEIPKQPVEAGLLDQLATMVAGLFGQGSAPVEEECPPKTQQVADATASPQEAGQPQPLVENPPVPVPPPREKTPYDGIIQKAAEAHDVNEELIRAIIAEESHFNPHARSREGAMGLMQLMPRTAKALGVQRPFHPEDNIMGGTLYVRRLLERYDGDLKLALTAYNWGPTNLENNPQRIPQSTQRYVSNIIARLDNQEDISNT
ncbi:MAG: transglycosylase SLT domain-containing protein [Magnetococcales bacterium]|nr:lytic transglycosylase domain-containing protein [Magnetococcales bacterium]NGZ25628.1 transglycosylase SLT domain-containing protein [Magnetococcales bacterium]